MRTAAPDGWIVMRSRVSLAGRVTDAGGKVASGGVLNLTALRGPDQRNARLAPHAVARRYDTRIRGDGFYFFLDLPAGDYVLDGRDQRGNEIEAKRVSIPPLDSAGRLHIVDVDLSASPTANADDRPPEAKAPAATPKHRRDSHST